MLKLLQSCNFIIAHFTVMDGSEGEGDLVLIHNKAGRFVSKQGHPQPRALPSITVKWPIVSHANKAYVIVVVNDKQCCQRSNCSQCLFINVRCQAVATASSTLSISRADLRCSEIRPTLGP